MVFVCHCANGAASTINLSKTDFAFDNPLTELNDRAMTGHPHARPSNRFVGRQREVASLTGRLRDPGSDGARAFLISGEPGIGKTRLLLETKRQAEALGWGVLLGHSYDSEGMP